MMTLDEVIAELEDEGVFADALFYLKEYRWAQENCADALAEKYPSENVPLDWETLKQMEGKPVWMEDDTGTKFYRGWVIILNFLYDDTFLHYVCNDYSETCVSVDDIGKTWQAYRKER